MSARLKGNTSSQHLLYNIIRPYVPPLSVHLWFGLVGLISKRRQSDGSLIIDELSRKGPMEWGKGREGGSTMKF